jgi:C1A family cysteine protease
MASHSYGYKKDPTDSRDRLYRASFPLAATRPASVDLRPETSPVRDQGQLGSCTGFACATGMREFLDLAEHPDELAHAMLSPLFLYWEERKLEGTVSQDSGAYLRDGMKVLTKLGCAPEVDQPYNVAKFTQAPSAKAVADAKAYLALSYHRLTTLDELLACLASGSGAVIGFDVYESFESADVEATGNVPMPAPGESVLGGHATFVAGYRDSADWDGGGYLIVKNSWGAGWGDRGYFYLPYAYWQFVSDAWVAVGTAPVPTPPQPPVPPTPVPVPPPTWLADLIKKLEEFLAWLHSLGL